MNRVLSPCLMETMLLTVLIFAGASDVVTREANFQGIAGGSSSRTTPESAILRSKLVTSVVECAELCLHEERCSSIRVDSASLSRRQRARCYVTDGSASDDDAHGDDGFSNFVVVSREKNDLVSYT